jgi:hypothetical protein
MNRNVGGLFVVEFSIIRIGFCVVVSILSLVTQQLGPGGSALTIALVIYLAAVLLTRESMGSCMRFIPMLAGGLGGYAGGFSPMAAGQGRCSVAS